ARLGALLLLAAAVLGPPAAMAQAAPAPAHLSTEAVWPLALLASPLRTEADRRADAGRQPLELLRLAQVRPGMKVLDIASEGGYTAQLMALAVGPQGRVWAQNPAPSAALAKRLAEHPQANLVPLLRPFDDPWPATAPRLDLITFVLAYHDVVNTPTDRARMNRALFDALRPGGHLVVIDHAAAAGHGLQDTKTLHRIEEPVLRAEVEAAGFRLEQESMAWRRADDPHTLPFFKMDGAPTDRFALRFVKPG
ncbi:MAG: class I SAM-dependent methyltransferase, partial [Burkholderiales bacterium]|nr:class I SAM-dependent methyltransferase [Burkholderiales bacterium]